MRRPLYLRQVTRGEYGVKSRGRWGALPRLRSGAHYFFRRMYCQTDLFLRRTSLFYQGWLFHQVVARGLPGCVASAVQNVFVHVDENQYGLVY